jgi:histidyl-tRNA synthetase
MPEIPFPRGVKDLMPNEALFRNEVIKKIENVYQRFGFLTIDTPTFESIRVLDAKGGIGEGTKQIFEIKDEDLGLRYDHTVSLARYIAMHQSLPLPFKRYYIGKAWRKEEPQKNRYREFTQADVDIVGGEKSVCDSEVIAAIATAFDELGIDYSIHISNRELIDAVLKEFGIAQERYIDVIRVIDKLDKIGVDGVNGLLAGLHLDKSAIDQINAFITRQGDNTDKLSYAGTILRDSPVIEEIRKALELLTLYRIRGAVVLDFSVMRGLDYYTGAVFEFMGVGDVKGSICGGGRYDNLIGAYGGRSIPAVGGSIGIDRVLDLLDYRSSTKYTYSKVFVAYVNESNLGYAAKIATSLRANGINTELNIAKRNLANQLAYANSLKLGYAIIIGDEEERQGKVKLRNLVSGDESIMGFDDALKTIRNE